MKSGWLATGACVLGLMVPAAADAATPVFGPIERVDLPADTGSVARFGKLNADSRPDFVAARWIRDNEQQLVVGRSRATGGFDVTSTPIVQTTVNEVAIADVNGDRRGDLVFASGTGLRWMRQEPDGTFAADQSAGGEGWQLRIADLNGDDRADVVLGGAGTVTRFLGTTTGFSTPQSVPAAGPFAIADLDGDGFDDIAYLAQPNSPTPYWGAVNVRLNDTAGGFREPSNTYLGRAGEQVHAADMDRDRRVDLVVTDRTGGTSVLLQGPGGGFGGPQAFPRRADENYETVLTDLDGDGAPDLVATANLFPGSVALVVYPGDGDGGLTNRKILVSGLKGAAVFAADVSGDAHPDLGVVEGGAPSSLATVRQLLPAAQVTSPAPSFDHQAVGTIGAPRRVVVTNAGEAALELGALRVTGGGADSFLLTADTCTGATIAPQATCSVGVRFAPAASGQHAASLVIRDLTAREDRVVALSALGTTLAAAAGPQGPAGGNGAAGPPGAPGPAGAKGADGAPGRPGRDAKVSCKLTGAGKKTRVSCRVTYPGATKATVMVKLHVRGRAVATRTVRLRAGKGTTSFPLPRGRSYRVTVG